MTDNTKNKNIGSPDGQFAYREQNLTPQSRFQEASKRALVEAFGGG